MNTEIKEFNSKLKKITAAYNHVSLIETNLKRQHFTRHGQHWNKLGKALVVKLVSLRINKLLEKGPQLMFNLKWKEQTPLVDYIVIDNQGKHKHDILHQETVIDKINPCRTSSRQKRIPVTRKEDFFMVNPPPDIINTIHNLNVLHYNILSLNNKTLELSLFLHDNDIMIDVLCFTEHWLSMGQIS